MAQDSPDAEASLFYGSGSVENRLDRARLALLDLSARNRLLNAPRGAKGKRSIEIVDERSSEVYRLLVKEEQAFTFVAGRSSAGAVADEGDTDEVADLAQPEDDSVDERGIFRRHADTRLQTRLTSKVLQKRLLEMYSDAITLEQEQGVNILFLALGMLKWVDPKDKKLIRYAPLVLIPVALDRTSAADRFKLKWRHEDVASNLSLEAFLDREHRLKMSAFEFGEDLDLPAYFRQVAETVSHKEGWEVLPDAQTLGFFSFAKFLMYRDLDSDCWPENGKLVQTLVHEHVGISECFVDLAIIDPAFPDRYALGIEVDGPSYSDLKSSRDRDRLRREVLEGHGWAMHRVWTLDWLHRPQEQLERCLAALTAQRERLQQAANDGSAERTVYEVITIQREGVEQMGLVKVQERDSGLVYVESALPRPSTLELHDTPIGMLADCVCQIVAVEGPIHADEVVTRLRAMWGLRRTGSRIDAVAASAINAAKSSGRLRAEGDFLCIPDAPVLVRDRSAALSLNLRKPEMLPPQEIREAITGSIGSSFGGAEEEIVQAVAARFGFQVKTAPLRQTILQQMNRLQDQGILERKDGFLKLKQNSLPSQTVKS